MDFEQSLKLHQDIINARLAGLLDGKIRESEGFLRSCYTDLKEFVLRGGKRLRPLLTIMAFKAVCDRAEDEILLPAVGIELFHNSSLIHDDIMDEADRRRGMPSVHKRFERLSPKRRAGQVGDGGIFRKTSERFGVSIAILLGDILYALTERCFLEAAFDAGKIRRALDILSRTYLAISEGQMLDILSESNPNLPEPEIARLIELKTGRLFLASVQIGAVLGGAPPRTQDALSRYALDLGAAFQLQDDLLDISPERKGTLFGSDIRRGKTTFLMTAALKSADPRQEQALRAALGRAAADRGTIAAAVRVLHDTGAVDHVKKLASRKLREGRAHLRSAALAKDARAFFDGLAEFLAARRLP